MRESDETVICCTLRAPASENGESTCVPEGNLYMSHVEPTVKVQPPFAWPTGAGIDLDHGVWSGSLGSGA